MSDWTEWPVEGWPEIVRYQQDVLRLIADQMTNGFRTSSWGGVEIGGVLFGTREGQSFSITDYQTVDSEHAHGPSYELTARDRDSIRKVIATARPEGLEALGWFKSVSSREIAATESDSILWAELFPEGILLILKRSNHGVSSGMTFCRWDGRIFSGRRTLEACETQPPRPASPGEPPPKPAAAKAEPPAPAETVLPEQALPKIEAAVSPLLVLSATELAPASEKAEGVAQMVLLDEPAKIAPTVPPFRVEPFALTPDPQFFYPGPGHREALAKLEYGISSRKGFIMLVGESGMGKTLLLECLTDRLRANGTEYGFLLNSKLNRIELFESLALDFDLKPLSNSKTAVLMALSDYLISRANAGQTTALLVDDAHNLSTEALEEIELLSNLETRKGKLLQMVMAVRPEFETRMNRPELAGLRQRFVLRPRLSPLSRAETEEYIRTRLNQAGAISAASSLPFDEIHGLSRGVPRLISAICGQLLERRQFSPSDPQAALAEVAAQLDLIH